MCNELATVRQNEEAEKKALIESRISHIAEKEMQRSLELALAESFEHKSPSCRSSPLTVASDDDAYTAEIEEIDEDEDEDVEEEEVQNWDFYGIACA
eukprot:4265565-Prymnesium_polylepis.1